MIAQTAAQQQQHQRMLAKQDGRYADYYDEEAPDGQGSSDDGQPRNPSGRALSAEEE